MDSGPDAADAVAVGVFIPLADAAGDAATQWTRVRMAGNLRDTSLTALEEGLVSN